MAAIASPEARSPRASRPLPLTPGRRAALVIGVPVCLALVAATGFSTLANFAEGRYAVAYPIGAATKSLVLNMTGQLTVKSTTAGQGAFDGTAHYSYIQPTPLENQAGGVTSLGYQCPVPVGDCELDATVTVPATVTTLTAHSGSGDATVTGAAGGLTGPVTISTGNGNLSVSHVSGPLSLNTSSGTVSVSAITSATLSASSGNGGIYARGVSSGTITANTDSGSINESGVTATTVTASSGNGDISIVFAGTPPRHVRVNTDSGNITILLPPGNARYHVTANTDSGTRNITANTDNSSQNVITASSGSGNITISQQ
jgi:Toastrack DUF4097